MLNTIGHVNRVRQVVSHCHYYDLFMLSRIDIGSEALTRLDLLERVVNHKKTVFRVSVGKLRHRMARRFHLLPADHLIANLRSDYKEMKAMIFGAYPEWDEIIEGLTALERRINDQRDLRVSAL